MGRMLQSAGWIVGITSALLGCSSTEGRAGAGTYRVNGGGGFMVVARHERHRAAITETSREVVDSEVLMGGPDGQFTLSIPRNMRGTERKLYLIVSKPGFALYDEILGESDGAPAPIDLARATSYRQEYTAVLQLERSLHEFMPSLDAAQRALVEAHVAARRAHLATHHPTEVAEAEERATRTALRPLESPGGTVLGVAALPGGGVAVVTSGPEGRRLVIRGAGAVAEISLGDNRFAALARDGEAIAVFDAGAIRRFDAAGEELGRLSLEPALGGEAPVTSLAVAADGFVLGVDPTLAMDGSRAPCRIVRYGREGNLVWQRALPSVVAVAQTLVAPTGEVLLQGTLAGSFDYQLVVAGLKKRDAMPRGIVRVRDGASEPEVIFVGSDAAAVTEDGLVAYAVDLYQPEDEPLIGYRAPEVLRQVAISLSWDGAVRDTEDLGVTTATSMMLGGAEGRRLIAYVGTELFEVELGSVP